MNLIKSRSSAKDAHLWNSLSKEEQDELLKALDEIEIADNLIDNDIMKKKHKRWL
jgi:hypothetical protein